MVSGTNQLHGNGQPHLVVGNDLITDMEISGRVNYSSPGHILPNQNTLILHIIPHLLGPAKNMEKEGLDVFVAEISVDGVWNWVLDAGGDGNDIPSDLEINDSGLLSVSGHYSGSYCLFESINLSKSQIENKGFIARITNSGFWVWANQIEGNGFSQVNSISDDSSNNLYITGDFKNNFPPQMEIYTKTIQTPRVHLLHRSQLMVNGIG